jgi:hypothetical protein
MLRDTGLVTIHLELTSLALVLDMPDLLMLLSQLLPITSQGCLIQHTCTACASVQHK